MTRRAVLWGVAAVLAATGLGLGGVWAGATGSEPQPSTAVELRVWQSVEDSRRVSVSARSPDGAWGALGVIELRWTTA